MPLYYLFNNLLNISLIELNNRIIQISRSSHGTLTRALYIMYTFYTSQYNDRRR